MHIVLLNFYPRPNPDYRNTASELRMRGHTVWLGTRNQSGDLEWDDGERVFAVLPGPMRLSDGLLRIPLVGSVLKRILFFGFMLRVRAFLRQATPDIVQLNPSLLSWVLPMFMPHQMCFILDIKQINVGIRTDLTGRLKDWLLVKARWIGARFFYDHACFDHAGAARKILGERWSEWATVVPVGISPRFLAAELADSTPASSERPVRFIYLGALTRFRELERLLLAAQRVLSTTDEFQIVFVGPDKAQGFYHKLVNDLNLGAVVAMMPPVPYEEIPELLASHDVGLAYVPDRPTWDYQPTIKVLEYRAVGLPILSTDVAAHREIVGEGVNGLLVQNSVESLAEGMLRFINDRDFLRRCRMNARAMRRGVTWSDVARMFEQDVYQELRSKKALVSERQLV